MQSRYLGRHEPNNSCVGDYYTRPGERCVCNGLILWQAKASFLLCELSLNVAGISRRWIFASANFRKMPPTFRRNFAKANSRQWNFRKMPPKSRRNLIWVSEMWRKRVPWEREDPGNEGGWNFAVVWPETFYFFSEDPTSARAKRSRECEREGEASFTHPYHPAFAVMSCGLSYSFARSTIVWENRTSLDRLLLSGRNGKWRRNFSVRTMDEAQPGAH